MYESQKQVFDVVTLIVFGDGMCYWLLQSSESIFTLARDGYNASNLTASSRSNWWIPNSEQKLKSGGEGHIQLGCMEGCMWLHNIEFIYLFTSQQEFHWTSWIFHDQLLKSSVTRRKCRLENIDRIFWAFKYRRSWKSERGIVDYWLRY